MPLLSAPPVGHRILVVEDQESSLAFATEWLTARGYSVRGVTTVDEAFQAMSEEDFCLYIVDQELPAAKDAVATVEGGPRIIEAIRKADPRRADRGVGHLTPVIAWTGYSSASDFVWAMRDAGADAFVEKGGADKKAKLMDEVEKRLALAGRADHADCAALDAERAGVSARPRSKDFPREPAIPVSIDVIGKKDGPRTTVEINGEVRGMQDGNLLVLLRLIDRWERQGHEWSDREDLGIGDSRHVISRVRAVFRGLAPEGFNPIQTDRSGRFRLHPEVLVTFVPWEELEEHPHAGIRKLAVKHNAWREQENVRLGFVSRQVSP